MGSRDTILEFWDPPPIISKPVEAGNFKFGTETDGSEFLTKKLQNYVKRGHLGSRDPLLEFRDPPPNISRTVEARNFKFGTETDGREF